MKKLLTKKTKDTIYNIIKRDNIKEENAFNYLLPKFKFELTDNEKNDLKKFIRTAYATMEYLDNIEFKVEHIGTVIIDGKAR